MRRFLARHADKITGVLEGFDRIVFRGWLRPFLHPGGMSHFLARQGVLLKDFEDFAKAMTTMLRGAAEQLGAKLHDKVHYLPSADVSKEMVARNFLAHREVRSGPICVLSAVEPCWTWQVFRHRDRSEPQQFQRKDAKCLHYYHYFIDRRFGFGHVRVQTWFPFQVRVYMNGREYLGRRLHELRLRHHRAGNCFPWIANPGRAQALMDEMLDLPWRNLLNEIVLTANPALAAFIDALGDDFYWTVWQSEWATDVMFKDAESLGSCYPAFVRHAIENLDSADVMRFLGRRLHPRYDGEITSDFKRRVEGVRVKHCAGRNSEKMYDKQGSVLRAEATINDPTEFKVRRKAHGDPGSAMALRPIRKGIVDLKRVARVGKQSNRRYLDSLAAVDCDMPMQQIIDPLTQAAELGGRRVRGLRPWTDLDFRLLQAVGRGDFLINGFRNRDIRPLLFPMSDEDLPLDPRQRRKQAAKVSRLLRLLRAHRIIERVDGTHRYHVTPLGRSAIAGIVAARRATVSQLQQCA